MSPEVLADSDKKKGHDKSVDIWSFGIFLFVLLTFEFPFSTKNNNNQRLFEKIKKCKVDWKNYPYLSIEAKNVLQNVFIFCNYIFLFIIFIIIIIVILL